MNILKDIQILYDAFKAYMEDTYMTAEEVWLADYNRMASKWENEMKEAAKNLDFEKAMELRDILFELKSE